MAIINHNSISGVTTVSVGSSIVVGDTFVITSNGLENITQISATGVITATSFSGALTGNVTGSATALSGTPDVTVGTLNATDAIISGDLTVQGTTTTLDTVVTEVDKLEVDANNTTVGVAITQSGAGDILRLYDGSTEVFTVTDGGSVGVGTNSISFGKLQVTQSSDTDEGGIGIVDSTISRSMRLYCNATNAVINSGNGGSGTLILNEGTGRIGIGTDDPTAGTDGESDDLVIHRASGAAGMTIKTANNTTGAIRFADTDGASQGRIEYNHPSDYLRWNTGGSERLRIDSSGNLSLAGDTDTYIGHPAADTLALTTGGTERLRITSGGQLNINALSESLGGKVIIKNNVDYTATEFDDNPTLYLLNGDQTTGISEASIVFAGRNTGGSTYRAAISGNGSTGLKFYTTSNADQNDDPAMIIRGSGNIGIGTDNPESLLHIKGTTGQLIVEDTNGASTIIMKNVGTNSSDDGLGSFTFTNTGYSGVSGIAARTASNGSGAILQFLSGTSAEAMRLDGSGRLLVNTTSARSNFFNVPNFRPYIQLEGTNAESSDLTLVRNENNSGGPGLLLGKSRGTSAGSETIVQSNDDLGLISFQGADGDSMVEAARIQADVNGTPGSNDMPGQLSFFTNSGTTSVSERLRITSTGAWGLAGANYGSSGQVLTSQGSSAAPQWATPSSASWTSTSVNAGPTGGVVAFTSIPSDIDFFIMSWNNVNSTNNNEYSVEMGHSGSYQTSGYNVNSGYMAQSSTIGVTRYTSSFYWRGSAGGGNNFGRIWFSRHNTGNVWHAFGNAHDDGSDIIYVMSGSCSLGGTLDRIRLILSSGGFDTQGSVTIQYLRT